MQRVRFILIAAIVLVVVASGVYVATRQRPAVNTIAIDGTSFVPSELTVEAGATVTWINRDPFPHNIRSASGGFRSGDLDPDATWQFRTREPGRFPYVCTLHPGMKGTLVVTRH